MKLRNGIAPCPNCLVGIAEEWLDISIDDYQKAGIQRRESGDLTQSIWTYRLRSKRQEHAWKWEERVGQTVWEWAFETWECVIVRDVERRPDACLCHFGAINERNNKSGAVSLLSLLPLLLLPFLLALFTLPPLTHCKAKINTARPKWLQDR